MTEVELKINKDYHMCPTCKAIHRIWLEETDVDG